MDDKPKKKQFIPAELKRLHRKTLPAAKKRTRVKKAPKVATLANVEPTQLSPTATRRLTRGLRRGLPLHLAAAVAGLDATSVTKWLSVGADDVIEGRDTELAALVIECRRAEALHAEAAIDLVTRAGRVDWRAAAWTLERRHGFGSTTRVTATVEAPRERNETAIRVDVDLSALTVAGLRALAYDDGDPEK